MNQIDEIKLVNKLLDAKKAYYSGEPIMSDAEFDKLEEKLRSSSPGNRYFTIIQQRTFKDKVYHPHPMLSMNKALDIETLHKFCDDHKGWVLAASPKMDGMSIELVLRDGVFSASTRGDGEFGEDCTKQVLSISSQIPKILKKFNNGQDVILRGEAVLTKSKFIHLNNLLRDLGKKTLSNPRNGVVGLLNNEKDGEAYLPFVTIVIFEIVEPVNVSYSHPLLQSLQNLYSENLLVVPIQLFQHWDNIEKFVQFETEGRDKYPFEIDGIIFRLDNTEEFFSLGKTEHHWRGAIAYKFPAQQGTVVIKDIEWSSGIQDITPVAIFDPIELNGANISRANLHSVKNMIELGACKGAVLLLSRQGDVIPMLHQVQDPTVFTSGKRVNVFDVLNEVPGMCPDCGAPVQLSADYIHLQCLNINCPAKLAKKIEVFAKALGIDHIGPSVATSLRDYVTSPEEVLNLDKRSISAAIGSDVIAGKIIDQIEELKRVKLDTAQFIEGLSLGIGARTVRKLFDALGENNCWNADLILLSSVHGVGEKQAVVIRKAFLDAKLARRRVEGLGFSFLSYNVSSNQDAIIFCITGTMSMGRKEFVSTAEAKGAKFTSSVTGQTKYLVCNDLSSTSSKLKKAQKLGIEIIDEGSFWSLLSS